MRDRKSKKKRLKLSFYNCQTDSTTYAYQFDSYIVDAYGKPLLSNVGRQAEPSISPDKWPAGVYHHYRMVLLFRMLNDHLNFYSINGYGNSKFGALTFITPSRIILGHLSVVM